MSEIYPTFNLEMYCCPFCVHKIPSRFYESVYSDYPELQRKDCPLCGKIAVSSFTKKTIPVFDMGDHWSTEEMEKM